RGPPLPPPPRPRPRWVFELAALGPAAPPAGGEVEHRHLACSHAADRNRGARNARVGKGDRVVVVPQQHEVPPAGATGGVGELHLRAGQRDVSGGRDSGENRGARQRCDHEPEPLQCAIHRSVSPRAEFRCTAWLSAPSRRVPPWARWRPGKTLYVTIFAARSSPSRSQVSLENAAGR